MAAINCFDFLAAVERGYPEAVAVIWADAFDFNQWCRGTLQIWPVPDWLPEIVSNARMFRSRRLLLDLYDTRPPYYPTLIDLPRGVGYEVMPDGHLRLCYPIQNTDVRTPGEELRIHATAVTLMNGIIETAGKFIESVKKQIG